MVYEINTSENNEKKMPVTISQSQDDALKCRFDQPTISSNNDIQFKATEDTQILHIEKWIYTLYTLTKHIDGSGSLVVSQGKCSDLAGIDADISKAHVL